MLKKIESMRIILLLATLTFVLSGHFAYGDDYEPVKSLVDRYQQTGDNNKRKEVRKKLSQTEPKTRDDIDNLRKIFSKKEWDDNLFAAGIKAIENIKDPSLDELLIEILKDEKSQMEKISRKDYSGKTETELKQRSANVMIIIRKLGRHKNQKAVPILKEYLFLPAFQYYVSEALGEIGDKSASEEMRERASKDSNINYGGLGLNEATNIIRDLEDKSKKDKWKKNAQQLKHIRDRETKPYLKKLFDHEDDDVRREAAVAFTNMVDKNDANDLVEMTRNPDWSIRSRAIYAMMLLRDEQFDDALINVLGNDRHRGPRADAARALGYKKVQKAVPYLEKALNDEDHYVRREAFISLYVLTGKKYEFKGRTQLIDRAAEDQSTHPSIY